MGVLDKFLNVMKLNDDYDDDDYLDDEIDDELKAQIFDKYVCGHQLTENNGVGLGLYFCKKIVEAHNGKISLDANGTTNTFKIELPISTENPAMIKEVIL